ncbi:hypothetical protein, conserved [Trypanosoma brucei gambiense DAL972]|uniref:Spt4/RpoE2 zinc finger domain-containing protein n=1 Tax=Trypanosoma brucei gambiense (strain MHOM/CI/86/DAL972) TaxID=679716 RepID=C9ZZB7_TRYB9|nr:hypothetical protein, conserved [Trypanosoma brucei gambiense DAL972]CBH14766.1 hypothetical protein, conserved [Trypanosoma brucei gambiense DAL972]|eukprot:XP_011777032.1 hypothetical protein, conserved [Trypanosoma brucei gambiense DAL972]
MNLCPLLHRLNPAVYMMLALLCLNGTPCRTSSPFFLCFFALNYLFLFVRVAIVSSLLDLRGKGGGTISGRVEEEVKTYLGINGNTYTNTKRCACACPCVWTPMSGDSEPPPQLPVGDHGYLACRRCRLIITEQQFLHEGCQVCGTGPVSREELLDVATAEFSNFIGLIAPEKSWVGRLINRTNCPNGVFATELCDEDESGEEDEEVEENDVYDEDEDGDSGNDVDNTNGDGMPGEDKLGPVMTDEELLLAMSGA